MKPATPEHRLSRRGGHVTSRTAFWGAWSVWALSLAGMAAALVYDRVHPLPVSVSGQQGGVLTGVAAVVRDRLAALDGSCHIDSWPGGGTVVAGRVPRRESAGPLPQHPDSMAGQDEI